MPGPFDRLSAFLEAFELNVHGVVGAPPAGEDNLVVVGHAEIPKAILIGLGHSPAVPSGMDQLAAAEVDFGGAGNPLLGALPAEVRIDIDEDAPLAALTRVFVAECDASRCGRQAALDRIGAVLVLYVLRELIEDGTSSPGLLAGLSHPSIKTALAAIHNQPDRSWRMEDLAYVAGMSRSSFMVAFRETVGVTPAKYLVRWRVTLAQRRIAGGQTVKAAARHVGFGSAEALAHACRRETGRAPTQLP